MIQENKFYVYTWIDPRNQTVFYVGKGKGKRAYSVYKKHRNEFFIRKFESIKKDGFEPQVIIVKENLTEKEAYSLEFDLINQYKRFGDGGTLTNLHISLGRGGTSDIDSSTRDKLSVASRGGNNSMAKLNDDIVNKIFDLVVSGKSNKEIEKEMGVAHHVVSDLRYGKKWKHLFDIHPISKTEIYKSRGTVAYLYDENFQLKVISEIVNRGDTMLKDIAKKYGIKTNTLVCVNLKRTWKYAWQAYERSIQQAEK